MEHDLAIVGSGGAGFAAAIAARDRGLSVVMIERAAVGGTCVNVGCIPSKALLAAAEAFHTAAHPRFPGITGSSPSLDIGALLGGKTEIVAEMRREKYEGLADGYGWRILRADARFEADQSGSPVLRLSDGSSVAAEHYLVATGASPWAPPVPGLDDVGYLTSTSAMELQQLPESLLVVGGNYVGLELGQLFSRLGSRVTLIEVLPRLAPAEEPEVSDAIREAVAQEGIEIRTSANLAGVSKRDGEVVATLSGNHGTDEVRAKAVLIATGRRPNTPDLGLESVGVTVGRQGEMEVEATLRSSNPRIWGAGDVTGAPQFVYVAAAQGSMVVENAFTGGARTIDYRHLPKVTFTSPTIASVGMTDAAAQEAGLDCECRVLPLEYVPRAIVGRSTSGLVKTVAERGSGRILGVHMVADGAGDAILAAVYALEANMTTGQLASTWAPYLTTAESIKLAAQSFTRDLSKLSCCAA
ncbi:MAG TPA: mercury(II) reductase [Acidimicrobiales bacterium]|nr:mercury(II) reductase [Acidimicrobiales bacterium]